MTATLVKYRGAVYRLALTIPTLRKTKVWHVGLMDPAGKGSDSYEGAGLSVSEHPEEWKQIAEIGGPTWLLTKPSGVFLNALRLTKEAKQSIVDWGVDRGLVVDTKMWRVWYFDSEDEEDRYMEFTKKKDAELELEYSFDGNGRIEEISKGKVIGTKALVNRTHNRSATKDPVAVMDLLLTCWVEDATELDGVWWTERLDPERLSAPRGVIVPKRLPSWKAVKKP